jgi:hypothetical protein
LNGDAAPGRTKSTTRAKNDAGSHSIQRRNGSPMLAAAKSTMAMTAQLKIVPK